MKITTLFNKEKLLFNNSFLIYEVFGDLIVKK